MTDRTMTLGIIGHGMLGKPIAQAWLDRGIASNETLWIANRRGGGNAQAPHSAVRFTTHIQELADACDIILLCVPPANAPSLNFTAPDKLVVSVMAGVSVDCLVHLAHTERVVRAMTSPAAVKSLAYSPWYCTNSVSDSDRHSVKRLFDACGAHDEVHDESQLDLFTALTGPVPGFVAYFAHCMIRHAVEQGVPPRVADRAVRQLFLGSGVLMASADESPKALVQEMIDYAGTTAAGLLTLDHTEFAKTLSEGLDAATQAAREIAS
ncbi:pyrroline-5-carboxylate reductase family protein [Granulosicoccus sp. 3-233]|uniref:pyrroline-5-carboxylate reductase family protein n=1 Tax=Granulosicoccus sp. 3-233 TaxID=3417969 RepID=UPI003D332B59